MPRPADFEEKEYERPLYSELLNGAPQIWTPGQVLENQLGFDAAIDVAMHPIWNILGHNYPLPGILLRDGSKVGLSAVTGVPPKRIPDFRVNLFIQAKRPSVMTYRTRGLKQYPISSPYWRFAIDPIQQSTLETVESALGKDAAVVYASPVFDSMDDLTQHTLKRSVVASSNFASSRYLSGHQWWAYDEPGGSGYGCSEPAAIEGPSILTRVELLAAEATTYDQPAPEAAIMTLNSLRRRLLSLFAKLNTPPPRISSFLSLQALLPEFHPQKFPEELKVFLDVCLFVYFVNVEWFVIG